MSEGRKSSRESRSIMKAAYYVRAIWDEEAAVWISESDIPGLVIETETLGEFEALVGHLAPEMLAINENIRHASVPVQFTATKRREFALA